jgi:hypothetical protein
MRRCERQKPSFGLVSLVRAKEANFDFGYFVLSADTPSQREPGSISALLVGVYEGKKL